MVQQLKRLLLVLVLCGVCYSIAEIPGDIVMLGDEKKFWFYNGDNYLTFAAPSTLVTDCNFTWPDSYGTDGWVLTTDGSGGLDWKLVQTQGDVLDDLNTLGVVDGDSYFLVGTGAGVLDWETGDTAATSMGLGPEDSPTLAGLFSSGAVTIEATATIDEAIVTDLQVDNVESNLIPDSTWDLGSSEFNWQHLYLSGNLSDGTNALTIANAKAAYDLTNVTPGVVTASKVVVVDASKNIGDFGTLASGTHTIGTLVLAAGSITDTGGIISFGDDNRTGTGGVLWAGGNSAQANAAYDHVSADGSSHTDVVTNSAKVTESTTVAAPLTMPAYDISIPVATTDANGYLDQDDWDKFNDHVDDSTQAHSDYLLNNATDSTTGSFGVGISPVSNLHIYEDTALTSSGAGLIIEQDGVGDTIAQFLLTGLQRWVIGVDNSQNDSFIVSPTADLSSSSYFIFNIDGSFSFAGGDFDVDASGNITDVSSIIIGDDTNDLLVLGTGVVTMTGDARVKNHLRIPAQTFKKVVGGSPPAELLVGIVTVLDFDDDANEQAYYTEVSPFRIDETMDVNVVIEWTFAANQDAADKKVQWGIEYIAIAEGETVNGTTTTVRQLSAGSHNSGEGTSVRTKFADSVDLTGIAAEDSIGIRVFRDAEQPADTFVGDARLMVLHLHFVSNKLGEAL